MKVLLPELLMRIPSVQECDATMNYQGTNAGQQKKIKKSEGSHEDN